MNKLKLFTHSKEGNPAICGSMEGLQYSVKSERKILTKLIVVIISQHIHISNHFLYNLI